MYSNETNHIIFDKNNNITVIKKSLYILKSSIIFIFLLITIDAVNITIIAVRLLIIEAVNILLSINALSLKNTALPHKIPVTIAPKTPSRLILLLAKNRNATNCFWGAKHV